ncbi:MAG: transcriptional regulator [Akkermansiaceae bacterium]|nr:transcriptional regulator [Akkermansiaceae bacterium]
MHLRKVTIIAERVLRDDLLDLLKKHGASGWTLTAVEGEGSRGIRASEWEGRNVQIDTLVSPEIADRMMDAIGIKYFADWSIIVYAADVDVIRSEKYLGR